MSTASISAAILTHNEAEMIAPCIASLKWCNRIVVLDHDSQDSTTEFALAAGAIVGRTSDASFARRREVLQEAASTDWILYIDADERVTPELATEIRNAINSTEGDVLRFPRRNYFFGKNFLHGGWQDETVTRAFRKGSLTGWIGDIHESPQFTGKVIDLQAPLWHFSHRTVADGLQKSAQWTPMEAELLASNTTKKIGVWTILRKGVGEIWRRGVLHQGWKDGEAGIIEVLVQAINRMLVYMQVWEKQQTPTSAENYRALEDEVISLWQKSR